MPFGRLHNRNPEIQRIARLIGRTADALGMKACNFASLDPAQRARGVRGLSQCSRADEELWEEFEADSESVAAEAEEAFERFDRSCEVTEASRTDEVEASALPEQATEVARTVRTRRVQGFFRRAVLISYQNRCALTGIQVEGLLNASHIIPWSVNEQRRADPRNGLCLNALHDRAFDRGLLTFDDDLRVVVSSRLKTEEPPELHSKFLVEIEGVALQLPTRFEPDRAAIHYHRDNVFRDS